MFVGALLVAAVVGGVALPWLGAVLTLVAGALLAAGARIPDGARSVAALVLCFLVASWGLAWLSPVALWPLPLALAVGLYVLLARVERLGLIRDWFARGRANRRGVLLVAAVVPVAAVCLVAWFWLLGGEDQQSAYRDLIAGAGLPLLILAGLGFALVNAASEELVYNGVLQRALAVDLPALPAVVLTAAIFGASHWYGFPGGVAGVVLAAAYGGLLAAVRHVSRGLLLPWVAHVAADLTIFTILALAWFG